MSHSDVYCIHKDELGLINADKKSSWMELYNKQNECILSLMVVESNTKDDKYHPVNIQQPDEAKAFMEWRDRWMDEVNTAVRRDRIRKDRQAGKRGQKEIRHHTYRKGPLRNEVSTQNMAQISGISQPYSVEVPDSAAASFVLRPPRGG